MDYIITIPDELVEIVNAMGYDINGWIKQQAIAPLLEKAISSREMKVLDKYRILINSEVSDISEGVKIIKADKNDAIEAVSAPEVAPIDPPAEVIDPPKVTPEVTPEVAPDPPISTVVEPETIGPTTDASI
jgi:hypothetical protein